MEHMSDVLGQCPLFAHIPKEKYDNVLHCLQAEVKTYPKGTLILCIGDEQRRPGVVLSGMLRLSLYSEDGNLLTIDRLEAGQIFGETLVCSMSGESPVQIDALSEAKVLYLNFDPLLSQQQPVCPHKMQVTANLLQEMGKSDLSRIQKMRILAQNRLRNRLKLYLQTLPAGPDGSYTLTMGRSELAEYLCVDRSALSRELGRMQKEGILLFQGRRVHILDEDFLEN